MIKRMYLTVWCLVWTTTVLLADGINYNGTNLALNNDFTRTQSGTMSKNVMPETSGLACSRTTPGYLWAHGDENTGDNRKIVAVSPDGTLAMTVTINSGSVDRDDWEDIAAGVYNNTNYLFIGAFGDNDLEYKDNYYIFYFEEPAITSGTQAVSVNAIRFGYPDDKAHNTETLLYDNVEQVFYIADKVKDGICTLYYLPFRTDYGSNKQTLTKVTELGNGSKFNYLTGGDITPDGHWMAIKNKKYVLLWERQGSESLRTTVQREPVQVAAYKEEDQGEALAWLDNTTFYTTSDDDGTPPIYKYTLKNFTGVEDLTADVPFKSERQLILHNGQLCIRHKEQLYALDGRKL